MTQPLDVPVEHAGRSFSFQLHQRELVFGRAGKGQYFWMDGRQLRHGSGGPNFRPCVDFWWHGVAVAGADRELEKECTLVLAECYPQISSARSLQDIYVDAHLHPAADRELFYEELNSVRQRRSERTYSLPEEEVARLRALAQNRSADLVRAELENLLLGSLPPDREMPAFDEAARRWIGNGVVAFRREGHAGLQRHTKTVEEWIRKRRRRGGIDRERSFMNMFSYECKVAFYYCYANAWVGILQTLKQSGLLDRLGERFLRIWHHQNTGGSDFAVRRDILCGQILALHPLSGVILSSPQHLEMVGRCIGLDDYERLVANGKITESEEYWDLIATVLIAAHEYDHSRRRWDEQRGHFSNSGDNEVGTMSRDDAMDSAQILFEDYAIRSGRKCPSCSNSLGYVSHDLAGTADLPTAIVTFRCDACGHTTQFEVTRDDLGD